MQFREEQPYRKLVSKGYKLLPTQQRGHQPVPERHLQIGSDGSKPALELEVI